MATNSASATKEPTRETNVAKATRVHDGWRWVGAKSIFTRAKDRSIRPCSEVERPFGFDANEMRTHPFVMCGGIG